MNVCKRAVHFIEEPNVGEGLTVLVRDPHTSIGLIFPCS